MHDALRVRLLRKIESLPEEQLYQVLDFIEFLEAKYPSPEANEKVGGFQRLAERLEDGLRRRTVRPGRFREAFQLISAADRVVSGVTAAGRQLVDEVERAFDGEGEEPSSPGDTPGEGAEAGSERG